MDMSIQGTSVPTQDSYLVSNYRRAAKKLLLNPGRVVSLEVPGVTERRVLSLYEGLVAFDHQVPRDEQLRWEVHVPRDPKHDEPDDGAIRKSGQDHKLYFHYRPDVEQLLKEKNGVTLSPDQQEWLKYMRQVWDACADAHLEYARKLDHHCPGYEFEKRAERSQHLSCLRILKYELRAGTLAKEHTDRDAVTFHLDESLPGLYTTRGDVVRQEESPALPNVLVFAGDQIAEITQGKVPACIHGVKDTTNGKRVRFASVFFAKMYVGEM